jgi:hypothetical protein
VLFAVPLFALLNLMAGSSSAHDLLILPFVQTGRVLVHVLAALPQIFSHPGDLRGVVGIVVEGGRLIEGSVERAIGIGALLSINLAVLNLLPIPALDGGKILLHLLEKLHPKARRLYVPLSLAGLALVFGLGGVALLVSGASTGEYPWRWLGYVAAILGAVSWGVYSNLLAVAVQDAVTLQRAYLLFGVPAFALTSFLTGGIAAPAGASAISLAVYVGCGPLVGGALFWQEAMRRGPVQRVASVSYLTPVLSTSTPTIAPTLAPTEAQLPSPTLTKSPGFELPLMLAGLLGAAYLVRRKGR